MNSRLIVIEKLRPKLLLHLQLHQSLQKHPIEKRGEGGPPPLLTAAIAKIRDTLVTASYTHLSGFGNPAPVDFFSFLCKDGW